MGFGGSLCIAGALATGRLVVVEPLASTQVLFALVYAARASRRPLQPPEWIAVGLTITGLAGFLIVAAPKEQPDASPIVPWAVPLGALTIVIVAGVAVARKLTTGGRRIGLANLGVLAFRTA